MDEGNLQDLRKRLLHEAETEGQLVTDDMMTMHYYIPTVCSNDNKAVIKNIIMEDSKTLF
jgi:hypothetical protein